MFLPDNDSYTFGRNNSLNKMFSLTSSHELIVKKPGLWSNYTASVGYYHWNNHYLTQGAEFNEKPAETYRAQVLDTLFSPGQYASLASALINSHQEKGLSRGDQYNATLYGYVSLSPFKFIANASYVKSTMKQYSQYGLNVGQNETDFRNRYSDIPSEKYSYDFMAQYSNELFGLEDLGVRLSYKFAGQSSSGDKALYRLDRYEDWDSFDGHPLGYLPSSKDSLQQVMDWQNSYFSKEMNLKHTPEIGCSYRFPNNACLDLDLPLNIARDKLSYQRAALDTVVRRNRTLFTPKLSYNHQGHGEKSRNKTEFAYTFTPSPP